MSWAPGRDTIVAMLDRRELEIVTASMDLANALLARLRKRSTRPAMRRPRAAVHRLATAFDELQLAI